MGTATVEGGGRHKRWFVPPSQRVRKGEVSPGRSCDAQMTRPSEDATLRRSLESAIGPEKVRMDDAARRAYSTDASPCAVEPRAVAFVETEEEVLAVLLACRELDVPVTPRASGTSLSGAAIGPGVVMDTTRFKRILEFDPARGLVRVEPGILLSELNAHLAERGMRFAPDPGSQDLCRIGGMVGDNACRDRSVKDGQTGHLVIDLKCVLARCASPQPPNTESTSCCTSIGSRPSARPSPKSSHRARVRSKPSTAARSPSSTARRSGFLRRHKRCSSSSSMTGTSPRSRTAWSGASAPIIG